MYDWGKPIIGFDGLPTNHPRELPELPKGRDFLEFDMNSLLPIEGQFAGMSLVFFEPSGRLDPVCLYDRWGRIVHQWPDGYFPSLGDVRDTVLKALKEVRYASSNSVLDG